MDKKHRGFKSITPDYDKLDAQLAAHRRKVFRRAFGIFFTLFLVLVAVHLFYSIRSYEDYEVKNSFQRESTKVTKYEKFGNYILEYSNDGIVCVDRQGALIWNQSFEMADPKLEICDNYVVIYDLGGTKIYILSKMGTEKEIEISNPIQKVCLAKQGTVAVLMKENNEAQIKLYDKKGNELASGKFYGDQGGFPIDIALSTDGTKLGISMVNLSKGSVGTSISFYNFGKVGQSEIDHNVGTYSFEGMLVPEISYVSEECMIGFGTEKILIFEGKQKPKLKKEIEVKENVLSFFHNEDYIGMVYENNEAENLKHIKVIDHNGKIVMEHDTCIHYDDIDFLANGEICVTNDTECELFTTYSIKKFAYTFDRELYNILSGEGVQNYIFIFKDTIEEVRLK